MSQPYLLKVKRQHLWGEHCWYHFRWWNTVKTLSYQKKHMFFFNIYLSTYLSISCRSPWFPGSNPCCLLVASTVLWHWKRALLGGCNPLPSGNSMEVYVKWPNLTVCHGNLSAMDENGPWFHHLASISFYRWWFSICYVQFSKIVCSCDFGDEAMGWRWRPPVMFAGSKPIAGTVEMPETTSVSNG